MQATRMIPFVVVMMVVTSAALGTSFVVPSDDWLIEHADAIVTGSVIGARTITGPNGMIETIYTLRIDDALKGMDPGTDRIEVVEIGGALGDEVLRVSGTPQYETGHRYLVFLRQARHGWTTFDLMVGSFSFRVDESGTPVFVRSEHFSKDATERTASVRDANEFLTHIRDRVERPLPDVQRLTIHEATAEPGDLDLAAMVAAGSWTGDEGSTIHYSLSGERATSDTTGDDGEDRVILGDPHDLIPGTLGVDSSVIAVAIYGCKAEGCGTIDDPNGGVRYASIAWSDVLLNDVGNDLVLSQSMLNTVLTHEFGHTLGFRHSNRVKNDPDPVSDAYQCGEPLPCSTVAVMSAEVNETLNGVLGTWDRDAANAVYGDGSRTGHGATEYLDDMFDEQLGEWLPARRLSTDVYWRLPGAACSSLVIDDQPQSTSIAAGQGVTLSISANGGYYNVVWYEGEKGNQTYIAGRGSTLNVKALSRSTSFWALASNSCSSVASEVARITVRPACPENELCALSNRFHLSLEATDQRTRLTGHGLPMRENDMFGSFSLPELTGNPENPEVFVKVLDGRDVNGEFWVFYGGLTDLDYVLTVTDVDTGETRRYHKPAGSSAGGFDVGSGVSSESCSAEVDGVTLPLQPTTGCVDGSSNLCLERGRFGIELEARDPRTGATGIGEAFEQNELSGYFALPSLTGNPGNPEVFVKVLDGRNVNDHFWLFFSGLTDLEYSIVLTDHATGERKAYTKPAGSACGAFDTNAF